MSVGKKRGKRKGKAVLSKDGKVEFLAPSFSYLFADRKGKLVTHKIVPPFIVSSTYF